MNTLAYYFRAHCYTMVPRQVDEDCAWLADHGTDGLVVGVLEQDFTAARENIDGICATAERHGLRVYATPSRWGNLVAGAPKVPSILCATDHDVWARNADGSPVMGFLGPLASVHHPRTIEALTTLTRTCLTQWPIAGVIWDEPKHLHVRDYSSAARAALGDAIDDPQAQLTAQVALLGRCNAEAKAVRPTARTGCFTYAFVTDDRARALARMADLDAFGCDGRPWWLADGGGSDTAGDGEARKSLLDDGHRFIAIARAEAKRSLALIENHALDQADTDLLARRLPEVLAQDWDDLLYYYYPRSCAEPDRAMAIIGDAIRARRSAT